MPRRHLNTIACLAMVLTLANGKETQLFLRTLGDTALVPIPGTSGGATPFFSPDGAWIAFTQKGKLRKIQRDGGAAVELCTTNWGGGTWLKDGRIIITNATND